MKLTDDITEYFECECSCAIISISKWRGDPEVCFSMYSIGEGSRASWRFRLGHIWHIIRRGNPYSDSIVLSGDEASRLAELLAKIGNEEA
jgi:hypothetical protein